MSRWMVDVEELVAALAGSRPPLLLDVRWNLTGPPGEQEFAVAHLPGSRWVDLETELSGHGEDSRGGAGRHPLPTPERFQRAMRSHGLDRGRPVVTLDGGSGLGAARLWWLLRDVGHDEVAVLDGGLRAWREAGQTLADGPTPDGPPGSFVARTPRLPVLDAAAAAAVPGTGRELVDVRAPARYRGESEPVDPVAGHLPGAVNLPAAGLFTTGGQLRSVPELRERLAGLGTQPVLYCGSGVTACQVAWAMAVAGREDVALYPGSWSDWVSDPDRPVATG